MEAAPRTSLWSRLVVFYSKNKPEQLNSKVMTEIISKYGSRERELSARLSKKYGKPLPQSVSHDELHAILVDFGMQDEDPVTETERDVPATKPKPHASPALKSGADVTSTEASETAAVPVQSGDELSEGKRTETQRKARSAVEVAAMPDARMLNFRSPHFNPLEALLDRTVKPPFPREAPLDNVFKFSRLLPAGHVYVQKQPSAENSSVSASPSSKILHVTPPARGAGGTGSVAGRSPTVGDNAGREKKPRSLSFSRKSAFTVAEAAAAHGLKSPKGKGKNECLDETDANADEALVGYFGPGAKGMLSTAQDVEKNDAFKKMERHRKVMEKRAIFGSRRKGATRNPLTRIMDEYAGTGPYSLLHRLHNEKRRARVMIRRVNSVRGVCTGLIRGFDRHMNILLADVCEDYTALVPARDPKKTPPRKPQPPGGSATDITCIQGDKSKRGVGFDQTEKDAMESEEGEVTGPRKWGVARGRLSDGAGIVAHGDLVEQGDGRTRAGDKRVHHVNTADQTEAIGENGEMTKLNKRDEAEYYSRASANSSRVGVELAQSGRSGHRDRAGLPEQRRLHNERRGPVEVEGKSGAGVDRDGDRERDSRDVGGGSGDSSGQDPKRKSKPRRSRHKGPWRGELVEIRQVRYLKQLLIRGDNVVMVWEASEF